jgi:glycosyltransferase involved in cell wall biosynthesis
MIIGYEAKRLFQNTSGLGNYSRNTVNMLARFFPENRYHLYAPKLTNLYTLPEHVSVRTPQSSLFKKFSSLWRVLRVSCLLKHDKVDIFHGLSNVMPFGIEKTGIPSVVTVHDLIFMRYPEFYPKIDVKFYRYHSIQGCRRATKVLAISHQTKNDLINLLGVDPKKIEVIHQSCDKRFYEKVEETKKNEIREKFHLPDKFILCVGTIEQRKNQLAILQGVVKEKLTIPVVILGKPKSYKLQLDEFILESGIRNQLIFLHKTTIEDLQVIYQMAEIMVYPSFFEGFGLPVLEAQASGCPVITSNTSSLPEAGGDGALYINPEKSEEIGLAIKNILTNSDLKEELIRKGKANADLFIEEVVAEKLMKLYQSLVVKHNK